MHSQEKKVKTPEQALKTLEWLSAKMERCTSDTRRSLYRWGITERETQDRIIAKLTSDGFISDSRYAGAYVRDKMLGGKWGEAKIRAALKAKSIATDIIEQALEENINKETLNHKLENNIRKHYLKEAPREENLYNLRAKLFRRAASQGFDIEEINSIISKIINAD
ncbi:MAG: regulatory protein RecX [Rikenellaceae bacterium]